MLQGLKVWFLLSYLELRMFSAVSLQLPVDNCIVTLKFIWDVRRVEVICLFALAGKDFANIHTDWLEFSTFL